MGITKRRLEAEEEDHNRELRLCAACDERIENEGEETVRSFQIEHSIIGPFTTVWHCGCSRIRKKRCVRCGGAAPDYPIPICEQCLGEYEDHIVAVSSSLSCARCGGQIPISEIDIYYETGMCGWCEHMSGRLEAEEWNPEKNLKAEETRIITPDDFLSNRVELITDPRLIRYLAQNPGDIFSLSPREFEEFVAELLRKMGYRTKLGPKGRDGGVDVFAELERDLGPELVLVQCKQFSADHKVSEPIVKQLAADVTDRKASHGLAVTTSTFSKPALRYIEERKYILSGADYNKLCEWLRKFQH
jgi:hypothetical protein